VLEVLRSPSHLVLPVIPVLPLVLGLPRRPSPLVLPIILVLPLVLGLPPLPSHLVLPLVPVLPLVRGVLGLPSHLVLLLVLGARRVPAALQVLEALRVREVQAHRAGFHARDLCRTQSSEYWHTDQPATRQRSRPNFLLSSL